MPKYKKRTDGRYCRQVKTGYKSDGKPQLKTLYARTQSELDKKYADFISLQNKGIILADENITLAQWSLKWLKAYKSNYTYNTYAMYDRCVKKHINTSPIANTPIKKIMVSHLQDLLAEKVMAGLTRTPQILRLTLKQIFKSAVENEIIYKNITDFLKLPPLKAPPKRVLTDIELKAIKSADITDSGRVFISLGLYAGLRRGEILALGVQDIDFTQNIIRVTKTVVFAENESIVKPCPKSTAGNREIPIPLILKSLLKNYIKERSELQLFTKKDGSIFTKSAFNKFWKNTSSKLNEYAGSTKEFKLITFTPHILRHTYATNLLKNGVDIKTTQKLLGHSTVAMTMDIYNHISINPISLSQVMDNIFKN